MDKKDLIYRAAVKVFAQHGFDSTKIQMIAEEAKIAVGTIYLYFNSKEEIMEYIICRVHQKRIDFLDRQAAESIPAVEKLRDFLLYHLETLLTDYEESKIIVQELAYMDVISNENVKAVIRNLQGKISGIIKEAQLQGSVRQTTPRFLTLTLLSFVKGFMSSLIHMADNENDSRKLKQQAISLLMDGITTA